GAAVKSDRKPAIANFVSLLFMLAPLEVPKALRGCPPVQQSEAPIATRLGQLAGGRRIFWQPLPKCCKDRKRWLTAYKSYSIPADVLGAFAVSHANVWALWPQGHTRAGPFPPPSSSGLPASLPISSW